MEPLNMFRRIALIDVMLRRSLGTYRRRTGGVSGWNIGLARWWPDPRCGAGWRPNNYDAP
jgi:hypothetical protein